MGHLTISASSSLNNLYHLLCLAIALWKQRTACYVLKLGVRDLGKLLKNTAAHCPLHNLMTRKTDLRATMTLIDTVQDILITSGNHEK